MHLQSSAISADLGGQNELLMTNPQNAHSPNLNIEYVSLWWLRLVTEELQPPST